MKIRIIDAYLFFVVVAIVFFGSLGLWGECAPMISDDVNTIQSSSLSPSKNLDYGFLNLEFSTYEISWLSSCKVVSKNSIGTGFVYHQDDDNLYIMTAGHVANIPGNVVNTPIYLRFFTFDPKEIRNPHPISFKMSSLIEGEVIWIVDHSYAFNRKFHDLAIIKVSKADLGNFQTPLVAKFKLNEEIKVLDPVITTGCEGGNWPTTLFGYIQSKERDTFSLLPAVAKGRSGSAIFDMKSKKVIGIALRKKGMLRADKIFEIMKWEIPSKRGN